MSSQLFNVLKCFQCAAYQVDQNKNSTNKWTCKLCGAKQSLKQVFFQGDAKDCRLKVQHLNMMINENKNNLVQNQMEKAFERQKEFNNKSEVHQMTSQSGTGLARVSKWAKYLDDNEDN